MSVSRVLRRFLSPRSSDPPSRVSRSPAAPEDFDPARFFEGKNWYQKWEVFDGVFTPGVNNVAEICDLIGLPLDLSGRRVLDIGSANGCMSLECERRGAAEVVGLTPLDDADWGHRQLSELVGAVRTQFLRGSVYDLDPEVLGRFDVVLFCGVLYHLRYPMLAIDNIRRIATNEVFIETHVSDDDLRGRSNELPLWRFYRSDELNGDPSNWFSPNIRAVEEAFESAGFSTRFLGRSNGRGRFHATVREGMPEFLTIPCQEAESYDLLMERTFGPKDAWRR